MTETKGHAAQDIYCRYEGYMVELSRSVERATRDFPAGKRRGFAPEFFDFATFQAKWRVIEKDRELHAIWLSRLSDGGLDREGATILRILQGRDTVTAPSSRTSDSHPDKAAA